jgi:hypothetical protein
MTTRRLFVSRTNYRYTLPADLAVEVRGKRYCCTTGRTSITHGIAIGAAPLCVIGNFRLETTGTTPPAENMMSPHNASHAMQISVGYPFVLPAIDTLLNVISGRLPNDCCMKISFHM